MKMTRRQRRIENKRRHRALRKMHVTTYDDLIRMHDRNPRRRRRNPSLADVLEGRIPKDTYTVTTNGEMYRVSSKRVSYQDLGSGWCILRSGLTEDEANDVIRKHSAEMLKLRHSNPRVSFRARGKRVTFWARRRRRGAVPRQLRPYVFKRGR